MSSSSTLIGRGSAKDLHRVEGRADRVALHFSDRISVFDYGALPDAVPGRSLALESSARAFFAALESGGVRTAWDRELSQSSGRVVLERARHPKFVSEGDAELDLDFVPLEVIFRWGAPAGSSLLKRRLDLNPFARFDSPLIEFTTKLESSDRLLDEAEAAELAGDAETLGAVRKVARATAEALRDTLKAKGLELWDGKIEVARRRSNGEIVVVDAVTLDELRVTLPGLEAVPLSKELLRMWLGSTLWAFEVAQAKLKGGEWKVGLAPPPRLGAWRLHKLAALYEAFAKTLEEGNAKSLLDWARQDRVRPKVFVMGQGGRESALRWRLEREGCDCVASPDEADTVWVSQDADLAQGLVDRFDREGRWSYGPRKGAAQVESSKAFGRRIAEMAGVPGPKTSAKAADFESFSEPPVVKMDGLAAGKGVVVAESWEIAKKALDQALAHGSIVLEERLRGFETSAFFAVETGSRGVRVTGLGTARDFKRRFAHDEGPNTGGMGAHAPHPQVSAEDYAQFREWALATARTLAKEGQPYRGILYLGFLKDEKKGWKLLEYNARFGDPETQALVLAWPDRRVLRPLLGLDLRAPDADVALESSAVCLAMVRAEYPEAAGPIDLPSWELPTRDDAQLFRSGSLKGRVAYVVGRGGSILEAGDRVFEVVVESPWKNLLEWRADILP